MMRTRATEPAEFRRLATVARGPGQLYLTEGWLAVEHDCANGAPLYLAADDGRGSGAAIGGYPFDDASNPWPFARPDLFLSDVLGVHAADPVLPAFCLGGRRPGHSETVTWGPAGPAALSHCVTAAVDAARARGAAAVLAPYVTDPGLGIALAEAGFLRLPSISRWELDLPGESFPDYLAWLPRGARSNVLIDRRRIREAGYTGTVRRLDPAMLPRLVELELRGYGRHGHAYQRREAVVLHEATVRHLPDDLWVSVVEEGPDLLAFAVLVRCDDTLYARQGAVDHERTGKVPVYFEAVYYQVIEAARELGIRRVDYSVSADRAKRLRGCREVPTSAFVQLLDPAAHRRLRQRVPAPVEGIMS